MAEDKLVWKGDKVLNSIEEATLEAMWLLGQQVLAEAVPDVPVETGTLLRSGRVTVGGLPDPEATYGESQGGRKLKKAPKRVKKHALEKIGNDDTVYVSYSTPYALWLHETPNGTSLSGMMRKLGRSPGRKRTVWHGHLKPNARWKWIERAIPKAKRKFPALVKRAFSKLRSD